MKRRITFLSAALMLLAFLAVPLGMWGQTRTEVTDVLNRALTGVTGTTYSSWSGKTSNSEAVYAGQSAGGNESIQLRSSNNNSGIVTTVSGGTVTKVVVTWHSSTQSGRTLNIYGRNTAYSNPTQLYSNQEQGELLGAIVCGTSTELTIDNEYEFIGMRSANGAMYLSEIQITWEDGTASTNPSITAENVSIAYDATQGAIEYTINNGVEGGVLTAATEAEWLEIGEVGETVPFTCSVNDNGERTATVTLTYTFNTDQTVTKNVTVTQAAAPVIYTTIPDIFAAATSTETNVSVTFGDWVVSGVSTNGKNVFVTDGTNGFVIYDNGGGLENTYTAGNILSGTVSCALKLYNGFAELLNVNADELTITEGGVITAAEVAMADLTGVNTGALLHYDNLTCSVNNNKYYLTDGTTTLQVYNSLFAFEALENGETYNITGIYQQYNNTKEILPRSAEDIVMVVISEPSITMAEYNYNVEATSGDGIISVVYDNFTNLDPHVQLYDADGAEVEPAYYQEWISVFIGYEDDYVHYGYEANTTTEDRTVYFKVYNGEVYSELATITQAGIVPPEPPTEGWVLTGLADLTANDIFVIVGTTSGGDSYAMSNDNGTGSAPAAVEVTVANEGTHLTGDIADNIKWNISGSANDGYTFYPNGDTESWLYCTATNNGVRVGTNDNNTFSLSDEGYLNNDATGRYVGIYNSSDWRCYTSINSNITGQTFAFYKKVGDEPQPVPSITIDPDMVNVDAEQHLVNYLNLTYENIQIDNIENFSVHYYDAEGEEIQLVPGEAWIIAGVVKPEDVYQVSYTVIANEGDARTAYFKVSYGETYSNLVTITQDAYVAPIASIIVNPDLVEALAEGEDGTLTVTYENITEIVADVYFCDANGEAANYDWIDAEIDNDNNVYYIINTNDGEARTAYFKVFAINGEEFVYSNLVTVTQNAPVAPVAEGWVLTDLADLTSNDVFVIVGTDFSGNMFAMSNNNGTTTAPAAVGVTVVDDMLENAPEANIQWNLSIADNGYTFYPNGNTESWLYCTTTSGSGNNNNMRVGDGSRNVFTFNNDGYMITNDDYATRYMSVYNNQEWRGYVNTNNNPVAISFYKKVGDEPQPVVASITVNPATVEALAEGEDGTLTVTYENITEIVADVYFCDANGEAANYDWIDAEIDNDNNVYYIINTNDGEARTAYLQVWAFDDNYEYVASNMVTVNQVAGTTPAIEGWVLTDLADLTEGDVFVIVGTRYDDNYAGNYAMPNDNDNSAPGAVAITINGEALAEEPAANLQWNISRTGNSYTFYPNGDTENWLYCTNANNGVKVGVGSAHHFTLSDNGYLTTTETTVQRYLGIYNSQDWRCYTSEGGNIANQTFAFYKKNVSTQTYNLTINGYGQSEGGYRLIASPVYVNPENTGMITDDGTDPENYTYDFYFFDQAQEDEWRNYRQEAFNLVPGKGYLYAHNTDVELTFTGIPYSGDGTITLVKDDNAVWAGWNLVGNPFGTTAYIDRDFYAMNETGTDIMTDASQGAVEAMQGVFVIAEEDGETLTFTTEAPEAAANVTLNLSQNRGAVIDRAIVRFGEGRQLPKFQLNAESTKLYIPQGSNDYAVVSSATQGEMPMNFKAQSNGSYTISVNTENAETNYLHLIDNMTGADIDLLQTPSYTFEAKTTDYASRFRLVFNVTGIEENTTSTEPFAFFNGSEWVINNTGEATLQMVDLTGRILSSESISGNATVSTSNLSTGIYMMRLVNSENVKTQKVVIK